MVLIQPPRYLAWSDLQATTDERGVTRLAVPETQPAQLTPAQAIAQAPSEDTQP